MYSLSAYGRMLADRVRFDAYRRALERCVRPGDVVVDLGAGPGVFALLAARLGASRVLAVDPDPIVELGTELAHAHDVAERVEIHATTGATLDRDTARAGDLVGAVDVLVGDLRGVLPVHDDHFEIVARARRWLRPGGVVIAACDHLRVAPVTAPDAYRDLVEAWTAPHLVAAGLALDAARARAVQSIGRVTLPESAPVAPAVTWASIDYGSLDAEAPPTVLRRSAAWTLGADATVHGLAVWFDSDLLTGTAEGEAVCLSSGPGGVAAGRAEVYGQAFLPWPSPHRLAAGDSVEVDLQARRVGDGWVWRWRSAVAGARFDQSTFFGAPLDRSRLAARAVVRSPGPDDPT
ncbi:MAG: 50S ribosomal protein L11 methyltransferase [Acidobacteriota bacterium]